MNVGVGDLSIGQYPTDYLNINIHQHFLFITISISKWKLLLLRHVPLRLNSLRLLRLKLYCPSENAAMLAPMTLSYINSYELFDACWRPISIRIFYSIFPVFFFLWLFDCVSSWERMMAFRQLVSITIISSWTV